MRTKTEKPPSKTTKTSPKRYPLKLKVVSGSAELTEAEELFCQEYSRSNNGAQSVIAAGYSKTGARQQACVMLRKDRIVSRIAEISKRLLASNAEQNEAARKAELAMRDLLDETTSKRWVINQLVINAMLARDRSQFGASNTALVKIGETMGMWHDARKGDNDERSPDEIARELTALLTKPDTGSTEDGAGEDESGAAEGSA